MPSAVRPPRPSSGITNFTNCRLVKGDELVQEDLWISTNGKILRSQTAFYDDNVLPDETIDLEGRIISPGLIDVQLNGAYGFNFSSMPESTADYAKKVGDLSRRLVRTGVTSFVPTLTSQTSELYHKVLPYLGPSGLSRTADRAESLGAHVEGPFLNPSKHGIHDVDVLRTANTMADLEAMYGAANIDSDATAHGSPLPVKMITVAPELGNMVALIPALRSRGIVVSMGHSEATYEEASAAVGAGATMITHLFNAMRPLHHRNPGIFGVLGTADDGGGARRALPPPRPCFGVIADGIHLHPATVKIAFNAHPEGFILVTDAMHMVGLPDGSYPWTNGEGVSRIAKKGPVLLLEGSDTIAGSSITLIECVNNFLNWTGTSIPKALKAATATPAAMLGLQGVKGSLQPGADADLVIFSEATGGSRVELVVDEVWKLGNRVFDRTSNS